MTIIAVRGTSKFMKSIQNRIIILAIPQLLSYERGRRNLG